MKTFVVVLVILLSTVLASAEQRIITIYTSVNWGGNSSYIESECKSACPTGGDINEWLKNGWQIVGTQPIQTMPINQPSNQGKWCRCNGMQYILQR